jgi:hypothetical protein
MTEVSGPKWGNFIPNGMGKDKEVYSIVIQEHNAYLETITLFDVYSMKEAVLETRFKKLEGLKLTLRKLAEAASNTKAGEVIPASPIFLVERTIDSNTKGKWMENHHDQVLTKGGAQKSEEDPGGQRSDTEYFIQHKTEPNFQAISTDPSLAAYFECMNNPW